MAFQTAVYQCCRAGSCDATWTTVCPCEQVEGTGADSALAGALAAAIRPQAIAEYEKALTAVFNAGAEVCPSRSKHT